MRKTIIISIFLITALSLGAIVFSETYGGVDYENAESVQQTSDGGYVIVGSGQSYGAGYWDAWMVKTDAYGTLEWHNSFGGIYADGAKSVQQTTDGGYILTGSTQSYGVTGHNIRLIKTDAFGDSIWTRVFGGPQYDVVSTVQQTTDGGYILSGQTLSYGAGSYDVWLIKTDENGILEWDETYGGVEVDKAYSVQQTTDDGYIITGLTESYGAGDRDVWLVKTDENGTLEWDNTYGGTLSDIAFSVQQTTDGGYIIAGETQSFSQGEYDVWLIKTDENGTHEWDSTFGGTSEDKAFEVKQTTDGGYILAAWTWSYGAGIGDAWLIKTDANGTQEWEQLFGGYDNDVAKSVQQTSDGGYIVGATTVSFGAGEGDFWLIKTDENGSIIPEPEIEINPDEFVLEMMSNEIFTDEFTITNIGSGTVSYDIEINYLNGDGWLSINPNFGELLEDETDTIEITFDTTDLTAGIYESEIIITYNGDEAIIPVTLTVIGTDAEDSVSNVTVLLGNYPNPFNPTTTINYNLAEEDNVTLEIYNLKGHKVKSLVNVHQSVGQHSVVWNGTDENNKSVSSGVYFYKLRSGRYTSTKKMILMK
ncbi:MAG: T9SS type A sorting domain-containing protein [Candidatus Cloacimonetes bacterium]|nr:T9SS type A sorting domain-containing protein [Candidatus Cloacimonadota bacterium]